MSSSPRRPARYWSIDGIEDQTPTRVRGSPRPRSTTKGTGACSAWPSTREFPDRPYVYVLYTYDHILGDAAPAPRWGAADTEGDPCPEPKGADTCLVSGRLLRLTADASETTSRSPRNRWSRNGVSSSPRHSVRRPRVRLRRGALRERRRRRQLQHRRLRPAWDPAEPVRGPALSEGGALRAQDLRTARRTRRSRRDAASGSIRETGAGLPDNPLSASSDQNARRIVGYGFRNPFRFAIDPEGGEVYWPTSAGTTSRRSIASPGVPGQPYNSGWPCFEGLGPDAQLLESRTAHLRKPRRGPRRRLAAVLPLSARRSRSTPEDRCRTRPRLGAVGDHLLRGRGLSGRLRRGTLLRRLGPWLHLRDVPRRGRPPRS